MRRRGRDWPRALSAFGVGMRLRQAKRRRRYYLADSSVGDGGWALAGGIKILRPAAAGAARAAEAYDAGLSTPQTG